MSRITDRRLHMGCGESLAGDRSSTGRRAVVKEKRRKTGPQRSALRTKGGRQR